jgi:hypothetical protein
MSERPGRVVDEMFAGIEGIFKGSRDSPEKMMLGQDVPDVWNLQEEDSSGTQNASDLREEWAGVLDMLKHVDERDSIKRTARKMHLLQRTGLDIQCELFTCEASADRARLHSGCAPASLSCSAQEEAAVASDIEEVARLPKPLKQTKLVVVVLISGVWSLAGKNSTILCYIVFLRCQIMTLRIKNRRSRVNKLAFTAPRYCDSKFAGYIVKAS